MDFKGLADKAKKAAVEHKDQIAAGIDKVAGQAKQRYPDKADQIDKIERGLDDKLDGLDDSKP